MKAGVLMELKENLKDTESIYHGFQHGGVRTGSQGKRDRL